ncbi:hypothetical protein [Peribacillus muralis]|uniref:hypothetical protein n=1 Tax=Peribacillus muralis TaxID=264697 RepID=UPI00366F0385
MSKHIKKATKLVSGAVSFADKAVADIAKANELISKGIGEDENRLAAIEQERVRLQEEAMEVIGNKLAKEEAIKTNVELLGRLSSFTL